MKKNMKKSESVTVTEVTEGNTNFCHFSSNPAKSWFYTLNNYDDDDYLLLKQLECNYHIIGKEIGLMGTPHLQGTITFKTSKRLAGLKKLIPKCHWEKVIDLESAINYCMKEKDFIIIDNRKQGKRNDLDDALEELEAHGINNVMRNHRCCYAKYHSGIEKLALFYDEPKYRENLKVYWYYGKTRSGKTYCAYQEAKNDKVWITSDDLKWFDGYKNENIVIFDDFRGNMCQFSWLLRLLDVYPLRVQVKGGHRNWNVEKIYITSCKHPKDVYSSNVFDSDEKIEQLLERIHYIVKFEKIDGVRKQTIEKSS